MTLLECGCEQDGSARCPTHASYPCHFYEVEYASPNSNGRPALCPPCRIAKWRSVSLSSAATPTRGKA